MSQRPEDSVLENHVCNFYCAPPQHCDVVWYRSDSGDDSDVVAQTLRRGLWWRGLTLCSFQAINELTPEQYIQHAPAPEMTSLSGHTSAVVSVSQLHGYVPYRVMFCVEAPPS